MFRVFCSLLSARSIQHSPVQKIKSLLSDHMMKDINKMQKMPAVNFSSMNHHNRISIKNFSIVSPITCLKDFLLPKSISIGQIRTVIKFSLKTGRRKTVKAVIKRFYRLNCGNWIRTIAGKDSRKWKKTLKRRIRNRQHVFCNATQCRMLDKMVSKYWRKPKYLINSPYEPYEWRNEFSITRRTPWRPEGCDYE